jgi:hypothetical protein
MKVPDGIHRLTAGVANFHVIPETGKPAGPARTAS